MLYFCEYFKKTKRDIKQNAITQMLVYHTPGVEYYCLNVSKLVDVPGYISRCDHSQQLEKCGWLLIIAMWTAELGSEDERLVCWIVSCPVCLGCLVCVCVSRVPWGEASVTGCSLKTCMCHVSASDQVDTAAWVTTVSDLFSLRRLHSR